jgi:predicted amidohydrolase
LEGFDLNRTWFLGLLLGLCSVSILSGQTLDGWAVYSQRPAIAPESGIDASRGVLWLQSFGDRRVNGAWRRGYEVAAGQRYRCTVDYRTWAIDKPGRSVVVQVDWLDGTGKRVGYPDYPRFPVSSREDWSRVSDVIRAPAGAASAVVDLILRWDDKGRVEWRGVQFEPVDVAPTRPVVISAVNLRPQNSSGPEENLRRFGELVDQAGRDGADLILLPEGSTMVGTGKSYLEVAETVPGPSTDYLGSLARRNHAYIVAGLLERDGATFFNTAVLIGRGGEVEGKYRKVSLPREEIEGGLTPGEDFPVFQTDFGRVGILICWDIQFPEGARRLAAEGAELILLPIWGGIEELFPARAIENQVYLVTSSFDSPTGIWNLEGKPVAQTVKDGTLATSRIDLEDRVSWEWVGDLRSRIPHEAPPAAEAP